MAPLTFAPYLHLIDLRAKVFTSSACCYGHAVRLQQRVNITSDPKYPRCSRLRPKHVLVHLQLLFKLICTYSPESVYSYITNCSLQASSGRTLIARNQFLDSVYFSWKYIKIFNIKLYLERIYILKHYMLAGPSQSKNVLNSRRKICCILETKLSRKLLSYWHNHYFRQCLHGTGSVCNRYEIGTDKPCVYTVDSVRIGSAIWYQMGPLMKVIVCGTVLFLFRTGPV